MPHEPPRPDPAPAARNASLRQVAVAVFWSFFGIRKNAALRHDAVTIKPQQVIIIGVLMAGLLVAGLLLLVRFIISG